MNIVTVVGARPQFIKAAVVARALPQQGITESIVHTGQHYDTYMSDVFFEELDIPKPNHNLGIGGGTHGQNTGRMVEAIEALLLENRPDALLVYGDTDSTLAGALAAVKLHVPVAHVEAGLRSFNRRMPEELNRILTDHSADILFAPTDLAVQNLDHEGIAGDRVHNVGDVMYDAALFYGEKAEQESKILDHRGLAPGEYVLATVHRAENTDDPERLGAIIDGFAAGDMRIVLPLHPRTKARLEHFSLSLPSNVLTLEPVGYLDMVMLEKHARLIATDSGGVQKEAFFHKVPCVTLRSETEWVELVDAGWNRIVDPRDSGSVLRGLSEMKNSAPEDVEPYGDGSAGARIAEILSRV